MTPEQTMLASFFVTLILIGFTSTLVMFFGLTPAGKNYKMSMRYFAFGIGLTSLLGSTLLILPIQGEYGNVIRETLSNTSYFLGVHCFRLGYCWRSGYKRTPTLFIVLHYLFFIGVMVLSSLDIVIPDNAFFRVCFLEANFIVLALTMLPAVKMHKDKPASFGERANFFLIGFTIFMLCCYPVAAYFSKSFFEFLAFGLPLQVLQIHVWTIFFLVMFLSDLINIYQKQAITDSMTGLYNRGHFFSLVNDMPDTHPEASLIVCDIDHFKSVNDTYGHGGGDAVIVAFSKLLQHNAPEGSIVARFGGEEFVLYLPNTSQAQAQQVAEHLRSKVELSKPTFDGKDIDYTVSFGVCALDTPSAIDTAINHADEALYKAKLAGRNQVIAFG